MSDKDLESFKIGDTHQTGISNPVGAGVATDSGDDDAPSVGFERIETVLENETPETIGEKLTAMISDLEQFEGEASAQKDKLAAQKAIAAIERVADLMDYLFQTKSDLQANAE